MKQGAGVEEKHCDMMEHQETLCFDETTTPIVAEDKVDRDVTFDVNSTNATELNDFLSRPVRVYEGQWSVNSTLNASVYPYDLFMKNAAVRAKLDYYKLVRFDLGVRIVINGTPFHYGRILVNWHQLQPEDETGPPPHVGTDIALVKKSQRNHVILNPTTSEPAEMKIPYVYMTPFFDLTNAITGAGESPSTRIGRLEIDQLNVLKMVDGGTKPVSITIFVWAENLALSHPTTYVLQSRKEAKTGVISTVASNAATIAKAVGKASPFLKPYMIASEHVATAVSSVARLFGFSRPITNDVISSMVPRYHGNLSNTNTNETLVRLSTDALNELTVDPRVVGLKGVDEMTIEHMTGIESYLTQFTWEESDPSDAFLWNAMVNPALYTVTTSTINPTALCYASQFFKFWRGEIVFRFQVVCSSFHKGRVAVIFEPNGNPTGSFLWFNNNYTQIIDISETQDIMFKVPFVSQKQWLRVINAGSLSLQFSDSIQIGTTDDCVGNISVRVLNDLTTSNTAVDNSVQINVFVHGMNMEFAMPDARIDNVQFYQTQSKINSSGQNALNDIECNNNTGELLKVNFGERIMSFRALLKRYSLHSGHSINSASTNSIMVTEVERNAFPNYRGYDPDGIDVDNVAAKFNYSFTTALNFLTPAFSCRRGGVRYKYVLDHSGTAPGSVRMSVARKNNLTSYVEHAPQIYADQGVVSSSKRHADFTALRQNGLTGVVIETAQNKPSLEVDVADYNNRRFHTGGRLITNTPPAYDGSQTFAVTESTIYDDSNTTVAYARYVAAAEDFSLSYWNGAPSYRIVNDPTPG